MNKSAVISALYFGVPKTMVLFCVVSLVDVVVFIVVDVLTRTFSVFPQGLDARCNVDVDVCFKWHI